MSLPRPIGLIPDASADASPPLDPPAVTSGFHGLRVRPWSDESVWTRRPRSGRLVRAKGIAPAARIRSTIGRVDGGDGVGEDRHALRGRRAGDVDVLLHRARHTVERTERAPSATAPSARSAAASASSAKQADDGVEVAVDLRRRDRVRLDDLPARRLPLVGSLPASSSAPSCHSSLMHPIMAHLWNGHAPLDRSVPARARCRPPSCPVAVGARRVPSGEGGIVWWRVGAALVVSLALQVGVNYANDYSDGVRGTDDRRVGPVRLVASGLASPPAVKRAAFAAFGVAALAGLALAAATSWWLLAVGAAASPRPGSTPAGRGRTATGARRGVRVRVLRARRDGRHHLRRGRSG